MKGLRLRPSHCYCLEVGSFKAVPSIGSDGTQLDLVPETPNLRFDEEGAGFAASSWIQARARRRSCRGGAREEGSGAASCGT